MAFKLNVTQPAAASTVDLAAILAANGAAGKPKKPKAKIWANPGVITTLDGDEEPTFVSLETGIALDTMEPSRGGKLGNAKNALREFLIKQVEGKNPGDSVIVMLPVQIRVVNDGERETVVTDGLQQAFAGIQVIG